MLHGAAHGGTGSILFGTRNAGDRGHVSTAARRRGAHSRGVHASGSFWCWMRSGRRAIRGNGDVLLGARRRHGSASPSVPRTGPSRERLGSVAQAALGRAEPALRCQCGADECWQTRCRTELRQDTNIVLHGGCASRDRIRTSCFMGLRSLRDTMFVSCPPGRCSYPVPQA